MPIVLFTAAAEADLAQAMLWYEARRSGLSVEFEDELVHILGRILQRPLQFPVFERDARRAMLRRFPYAVFFRADERDVLVLGVFHTRQNPQIWRARL